MDVCWEILSLALLMSEDDDDNELSYRRGNQALIQKKTKGGGWLSFS